MAALAGCAGGHDPRMHTTVESHGPNWPAPTLGAAPGWHVTTAVDGGIASAEASTVPSRRRRSRRFPRPGTRCGDSFPRRSSSRYLLEVRVFFGTQDPSGDQVARAQAELNTLSWG
jgi:hypothetical protein